jgi:uncharacterized alpha/beta hydrolase family protein
MAYAVVVDGVPYFLAMGEKGEALYMAGSADEQSLPALGSRVSLDGATRERRDVAGNVYRTVETNGLHIVSSHD